MKLSQVGRILLPFSLVCLLRPFIGEIVILCVSAFAAEKWHDLMLKQCSRRKSLLILHRNVPLYRSSQEFHDGRSCIGYSVFPSVQWSIRQDTLTSLWHHRRNQRCHAGADDGAGPNAATGSVSCLSRVFSRGRWKMEEPSIDEKRSPSRSVMNVQCNNY
jgi:hypothetical protein